jgi:uncharacterized Zn finger protein (UPF0148 family)
MGQYPYLKKIKMQSSATVLCDICKKVHVPASKAKVRGKVVCVHCRTRNEKRKYDETRVRNGKHEQKRGLLKNSKSC